MATTKIRWANYVIDGEIKATIYFDELDTDLYESKYKGNLYCVNGCEARIKFTQRKNNTKFFSTWNKEGDLHSEECEFHVKYKNKIGRMKLIAKHEAVEVKTEHILNTIKNRINSMKGKKKPKKGESNGTNVIQNIGVKEVNVVNEEGGHTVNGNKNVYIGSLDAEYMTEAYVDLRKCVYGKIDNVQISDGNNEETYAYFNLVNKHFKVSVHIPPAFYYSENNNILNFKEFIKVLQDNINLNDKEYIFVGVGFIRHKKGEGLNLRILNKDHFVINETSYDKILRDREIKELDYTY